MFVALRWLQLTDTTFLFILSKLTACNKFSLISSMPNAQRLEIYNTMNLKPVLISALLRLDNKSHWIDHWISVFKWRSFLFV